MTVVKHSQTMEEHTEFKTCYTLHYTTLQLRIVRDGNIQCATGPSISHQEYAWNECFLQSEGYFTY